MAETEEKFGAPVFPRAGRTYTAPPRKTADGRIHATAVQTIDAEARQIYALYTRAELLPAWQEGVISVTQSAGDRLHWKMETPGTGGIFEFDSEVTEAVAGKRHTSRIVDGPFAGTTDTVTFEPHLSGRGTVVQWVSDFKVPAPSVTRVLSGVFSRTPQQLVAENLRHLKQLVESGEIPTVDGQSAGPRGAVGWLKRLMLKENLPTPHGTSDRERPEDLPQHGLPKNVAVGGVMTVIAGAVGAWLLVRALKD